MFYAIGNILKNCKKNNISIAKCLKTRRSKINQSKETKKVAAIIKRHCEKEWEMEDGFEYKLINVYPIPYSKRGYP